MELQWDKMALPCLEVKLRQVQNQEQTLEVRLGDDMPDIGRIICGWGQSILRGKQWNSDHMVVSGGIMAYILYSPEDGSAPRCVQAWLPYSMKWNFPQCDRDGIIRANIQVKSVDARVLSARKMMVRGCVSGLAEALEPKEAAYYTGAADQEHVYVLKQTYPVLIPAEAGEKTFFGEMGMIDDEPRSATAVAMEDTEVAVITPENFADFFKDNPEHIIYIMQNMSKRIRNLTNDYLDACRAVAEAVETEKNGKSKSDWFKERVVKFINDYNQSGIRSIS
jgi:hypothetical protein